MAPSGIEICIGLVASHLFTTGTPSMMKWPVVPESEWALCTGVCVGAVLVALAMIAGGNWVGLEQLEARMVASSSSLM